MAQLPGQMIYSNDELEPPKWIDGEYLRAVIQHDCKEKIEIKNFHITPAASACDHFASLIFRVAVNFSSQKQNDSHISLIIKTLPTEDGLKKDIVDSYDVFAFESRVFSKIIPVCHEMLAEIGCLDIIGARMLYQSNQPVKNIVLQDLAQLGYGMSQTNYPSVEVYRAMFEKLALFHATTLKMHEDGNQEVSKCKGVFFNMSNIKDVYLFSQGKDLLADVIKTIPGLECYSKKLKDIPNASLIDKCLTAINEPGTYNVLNHGDLYIKNLMMKDKQGGNDIVFVDFQLCHWGSPAVDIEYIASFIPLQAREAIIRNYFHCFIDTLKKLGYKGNLPNYDQLECDIQRRRPIELFLLICSAPFMFVASNYIPTQNMDIKTFMADRKFISESFKEPKYVSLLKEMLPVYVEQGLFEEFI